MEQLLRWNPPSAEVNGKWKMLFGVREVQTVMDSTYVQFITKSVGVPIKQSFLYRSLLLVKFATQNRIDIYWIKRLTIFL